MQLTRIPNLTITASVEGINEPYTLCGDFINVLNGFDEEGNHSVAKEIRRRLATIDNTVLDSIYFDPEYSHLYVYGEMIDLLHVAKVLEAMYEEAS